MSIIIKQDEVNYLIYQYLLESGYTHTAYAMFHETRIDQKGPTYESDAKAGHLIFLLERALIFNQLEQHSTLNKYCECQEPQQLIKPHQCFVVEKKRQEKAEQNLKKETEQLDSITRTRNFLKPKQQSESKVKTLTEDAFLQSIQANHCPGGKVPTNERGINFCTNNKLSLITAYQPLNSCLANISFSDDRSPLDVAQVIPCCIGEQILEVKAFDWDLASNQHLAVLFTNYMLLLTDSNGKVINILEIEDSESLVHTKWNPNWNNVMALVYKHDITVIDPIATQTLMKVSSEKEILLFEWRIYDQYLVLYSDYLLEIKILENNELKKQYQMDQGTNQIVWNGNKTIFASFSPVTNTIKVWTLNQDVHVIELSETTPIKNFGYCSQNQDGVGNIILSQTEKCIKVYDIDFGELKYQLDLQNESIRDMFIMDGQKGSIVAAFTQEKTLHIVDLKDHYRIQVQLKEYPSQFAKVNEKILILQSISDYYVLNFKKIEFAKEV